MRKLVISVLHLHQRGPHSYQVMTAKLSLRINLNVSPRPRSFVCSQQQTNITPNLSLLSLLAPTALPGVIFSFFCKKQLLVLSLNIH